MFSIGFSPEVYVQFQFLLIWCLTTAGALILLLWLPWAFTWCWKILLGSFSRSGSKV